MANVECSVPEELLVRRETAFDSADAFGIDVAYFIEPGDESLPSVRVALYSKRIPKRNTFETGETPLGFNSAGKTLTFPVEDNPGEFICIVEARVNDEITNRGVHVIKKFGALAETSLGGFQGSATYLTY